MHLLSQTYCSLVSSKCPAYSTICLESVRAGEGVRYSH
uniref:Uncharacterized protein n=2 Tax=Anguilla anguilla TaxID=7936 RepID=A0A0E9T8G7_ANGAN